MKAIIGIIAALILAAAAAVGGYLYGAKAGEARAQATYQSFFQGRGVSLPGGAASGNPAVIPFGTGGQTAQGQGQAQGGAVRGGVTGQVTGVEGNTITLTTADGAVKVLVNEQTTLRKTTTLTLQDLQSNDTAMVVGDRDAQGNLVARSIQFGVDLPQQRTRQP